MSGIEIYLWFMRFGLFVILFGILTVVFTNKKVALLRPSAEKAVLRNSGWNGWNKFLYKISSNSFFKTLALKQESDEYLRLEKKIAKTGGLGGLIPEILQVYRVGLPILFLTGFIAVTVVGAIVRALFGGAASSLSDAQLVNSLIALFVMIALYFLPEQVLNFIIRERQAKIHQELYNIGPFTISMLESQAYGTYEIIQTLSETTLVLRPYMKACLNEYYLNPRQAIQNMADKVGDDNFQVICNGLKQVVEMNKQYTALFMRQHLDEINRLRMLQREARIKKKPLVYVLLLVFPLVSIVAVWFYPWMIQAMDVLSGIF